MTEFETKKEGFDNSNRCTTIIIPVIKRGEFDLSTYNAGIGAEEIGFDSESMSDLIRQKCGKDQGFVRRFRLNSEGLSAMFSGGDQIDIEDIQLAAFANGIGFLMLSFQTTDEEIKKAYGFINPGYLVDQDANIQQNFIADINAKVLSQSGFEIYVSGDDKKLAIKESYLLNAAFTDCRFENLETIDKATFNVHKLIRLGEDFEDASESDITYAYGARDVENKTYRWGCCISSQSISFVYGPGNSNYDTEKKQAITSSANLSMDQMIVLMEEDLLTTLLVLYQKYTCTLLTEKIHTLVRAGVGGRKSAQKIKSETLYFKAYDTIAPSQISRWNNVCETYRNLLEMNGVPEALQDVSDSIEVINEEMERISAGQQDLFATILAVFGLISIVAAVLQVVDYVQPGDPTMLFWTALSGLGILALGIAWLIMRWKNR